jgi:D-glycero-D-manno-heptose 1,7-bisphosphate phosphatase
VGCWARRRHEIEDGVVKPAIFMDRDGTLSHEKGYMNHPSRYQLFPFAIDAVRLINRSGFLAVLVTNQAGVARGYFEEPLIEEVHASIEAALHAGDARLDGIYYCTHHPKQECDCRKPRPGLILKAQAELDIDLSSSYVVGDRPSDLELAWNVGARGVLVKTGYGRGEWAHHASSWPRQPDIVAEHLLEAVLNVLWERRQ